MIFPDDRIGIIILGAGLGKRMKSDKAKVLHPLCGRPMILHVIETALKISGTNITVVVGHQAKAVQRIVSEHFNVRFALQQQQLGTGHAVSCALPHLPVGTRQVVILCGDVPLVATRTIQRMIEDHITQRRDVTVLGVEMKLPRGYGRIVVDDEKRVAAIVEEADADAETQKINTVNTGIYCVELNMLSEALMEIDAENAQGEYYLTDIISIGQLRGRNVGMVLAGDEREFHGINSREDLEAAEKLIARIKP